MNVAKTLLQTTVFWTLVLLVVPSWIVRLTMAWAVPGTHLRG